MPFNPKFRLERRTTTGLWYLAEATEWLQQVCEHLNERGVDPGQVARLSALVGRFQEHVAALMPLRSRLAQLAERLEYGV